MIQLPARLAKVARSKGQPILHIVANDDRPDLYRTRMSTRLYQNFIRRRTEDGVEPYLSISHYKTVIGRIDRLYIDGRYLKATILPGVNPIAQEFVSRLQDEEYRSQLGFSIGFNDIDSYVDETVGDLLVYTDGLLVHIAATSIPANPRSRILEISMRARTQYDDAADLVGPVWASYLEKQENP